MTSAGWLFLAFPSILPASLTLVVQHDGRRAAADDALGSVVGAVGLAAFGAVVGYAPSTWSGACWRCGLAPATAEVARAVRRSCPQGPSRPARPVLARRMLPATDAFDSRKDDVMKYAKIWGLAGGALLAVLGLGVGIAAAHAEQPTMFHECVGCSGLV
jgi:hypothetical protein